MRSAPSFLQTMLNCRLEELAAKHLERSNMVGKEKEEKKKKDLPILVDHVGNAEPLVDDLAPAVAVEVLGAQLAGGQEPRGAVGVGRVLVQRGQLLARAQQLLQAEEVAVDAAAVAGVERVLGVRGQRGAEQAHDLLARHAGVLVGPAEGDALVGHGARGLGAALLELARRGRLVRGAVLAVHLVVGQLDEHLHVRVRAALELLDQALAVGLEGLHAQLVLGHVPAVLLERRVDGLLHRVVDVEGDGLGLGQVGAHGRVGEVEAVVEDDVVDVVVEAVRGRAVHHAVLAHEAGGGIVVDDELQRLVEPAVAAVAVPVLVRALLQGHRGGVVQADEEAGRLDLAQGLLVGRVGRQQLVAGVGPEVAVGGSQDPDGRGALGDLVDALKLPLQLGGVERAAVHHDGDPEEPVLADDDDVLVLVGRVLPGVVGARGGDAAAVEHVLVGAHGLGLAAQVLGLQGARVDLALEVEHGGGDGGGALGRVAAVPVVAVRVEVGDVGDDGVAVAQVGGVVPPLGQPILDVGVGGALEEALLQRLALAAGADEGLDGLGGALILGGGEERVDGLEVAAAGLLEGGDGETGEGVLEAEHPALGQILLVP